jgi:L-lactate dehydrogenase (cytochrome)
VAGLDDVLKAGEILKDELHRNMALLGVTAIDEISKGYLVRLRS